MNEDEEKMGLSIFGLVLSFLFCLKAQESKTQTFSEARISKRKFTLKQANIFLWHMWKRSIAPLWLLTIQHFASWEKSYSPRISQ